MRNFGAPALIPLLLFQYLCCNIYHGVTPNRASGINGGAVSGFDGNFLY
jgi:hypothetical protein